jgi:DNA ligase-1
MTMTHTDLMHGLDYSGQDVTGWLAQEKLDGLRALWTGSKLISRTGQTFAAPDWFLAGLPDCPLDGELYAGPGTMSRLSTRLARWKSSRDEDWQGVNFHVFDSPTSAGGIVFRMAKARAEIKLAKHARPVPIFSLGGISIAFREGKQIQSHDGFRTALAAIKDHGGEGLMLREPGAPYVAGRSQFLLKYR